MSHIAHVRCVDQDRVRAHLAVRKHGRRVPCSLFRSNALAVDSQPAPQPALKARDSAERALAVKCSHRSTTRAQSEHHTGRAPSVSTLVAARALVAARTPPRRPAVVERGTLGAAARETREALR